MWTPVEEFYVGQLVIAREASLGVVGSKKLPAKRNKAFQGF